MIENQLDVQFHEALSSFEKSYKGDSMNIEKFEFVTIDKNEISEIIAEHFAVDKSNVCLTAYEDVGEWGRSYEIQCEIKRKVE